MAAYWIVRTSSIKDKHAKKEYVNRWTPVGKRYGAEIIAASDMADTREGKHYERQLIIRFPSYTDAVKCYEDADYQSAMEFAKKAFDRELSIVSE